MSDNQNTNKKIVSGIFWKFGERLISQGVSFIVSLILARILMPEDYGAVAIVTIFTDIANVILVSGLNTALIQKKDITSKETSTVFYCGLGLSIFLYLLLFFTAPLLAYLYKLPILIPVIRVLALSLPISAMQSVQMAILSRNLDFKKCFYSTIGGTSCSAVVGILMALGGYGVWALVTQNLVMTFISTVVITLLVRWKPTKEFSLRAAKPLLSYGWKVMATDLSGTVFGHLSSMVIGVRYTSVDLAFFTKGKQLPYMLRNNIYTTLISVLFPAMAQVSGDPEALKESERKSIRMLCYVIFPIMFGMIFVSKNMVIVLLTEKWLQAVPYICFVCIECVLTIIPTVRLQVLKAAGHSGAMLKLEIVKKTIYFLSILAAMPFGVFAIALTLPFNALIDVLLHLICSKKILGYSMWGQMGSCFSSLLLCALMGAAIWAVSLLHLSALPMLAIQVSVGVAVYVGFSAIFKVEAFMTMLNMVKEKLKA